MKKKIASKKKKSLATQKIAKKKMSVKRKKKVTPIPKGYTAITPYLIVNQAAKAIEFYKKAFGAKEVMRMQKPDGKVGHAELKFGDAKIMLADEFPEMDAKGPDAFGGSPMMIHLYVKNADAVMTKAISAGAKLLRAAETMFYGDRNGMVQDPYGYKWCVSTHVEDVTQAQMRKRAAALYGKK